MKTGFLSGASKMDAAFGAAKRGDGFFEQVGQGVRQADAGADGGAEGLFAANDGAFDPGTVPAGDFSGGDEGVQQFGDGLPAVAGVQIKDG